MTEIYDKIISHAAERPSGRLELAHKVWDPTPFVIDVFVGEQDETGCGVDEPDIRAYCLDNFGDESWPIHGRPGNWYRGGATVCGWTWYGFKTVEMLGQFRAAWPDNVRPLVPS